MTPAKRTVVYCMNVNTPHGTRHQVCTRHVPGSTYTTRIADYSSSHRGSQAWSEDREDREERERLQYL